MMRDEMPLVAPLPFSARCMTMTGRKITDAAMAKPLKTWGGIPMMVRGGASGAGSPGNTGTFMVPGQTGHCMTCPEYFRSALRLWLQWGQLNFIA